MFLDNTYFQGELSIPNLIFVEPGGVGTMIEAVNEQSFDWYLGKYEVKFMNELLGSEMYSRMMTEIEDGNAWSKLRNKIYVHTGSGNYSPAANYVYFYSTRNMQTQTSPQGEVRGRKDYSSVVSANPKLVKVWNDMVDMITDIRKYIGQNECLYGKIGNDARLFKYINTFGI